MRIFKDYVHAENQRRLNLSNIAYAIHVLSVLCLEGGIRSDPNPEIFLRILRSDRIGSITLTYRELTLSSLNHNHDFSADDYV